jgi:catalase
MKKKDVKVAPKNKKVKSLETHTEDSSDQFLTTNQGLKINDNQNSLKAGDRGPTLLEDFIFREKITHFDHERIPERIVHARGAAAHGIFQLYKPLKQYTKAKFLNDTSKPTPVFVRFSTVAGSRGSTDLARDVRGFAVKFYTDEGNFDLVGNNIPVFFIQDALKFPDLIHAVKPEPHNEIPQAASAHDTFWDFVSVMPESMHMIMWVMSDRGIPRSFRMMEGFGIHTFRLVNEQGRAVFVKFHWKPLLGVHSVAWDEAQKISGKNPDFHRQDLYDAIESGAFPEWEFGIQIIPEKDEHKFNFDLLDPTKIVPEELVPVTPIGKLTLNRNPDNFFAETEQVAFHPGHLVPGIDFTNDPLLQGRLFSYTDTQLSRLGSPNFHEIPINRPIAPLHNNQRDGHMRQTINKGKTSYEPNTMGGGCPFQAKMMEGGFASYAEKIDAQKIRGRSPSFFDHFSQARLFYLSQSDAEKDHLMHALSFELGKVNDESIKTRVLGLLNQVDKSLAEQVSNAIGVQIPSKPEFPMNRSFGADADPKKCQPTAVKKQGVEKSAALSMEHSRKNSIETRQVAILMANGSDEKKAEAMRQELSLAGAIVKIIAPKLGNIKGKNGKTLKIDQSFLTSSSVLFDAVYVPGGAPGIKILINDADAINFVEEAYRHCKAIALDGEAMELFKETFSGKHCSKNFSKKTMSDLGVILDGTPKEFAKAIAQHRFWLREKKGR